MNINVEEVDCQISELSEYFAERNIQRMLPYFIPESIPGPVQHEPTFYQRFQGVMRGAEAGEWKT